MDVNRQHGHEASTLPAIFIGTESSDRFLHSSHQASFDKYSSPTTATAMSIPGIKQVQHVPPPLPPPTFPFGKPPGSDYQEPPRGSFASFNSPGEPSLFGSFGSSMGDRRERGPTLRADRDEGYSSLSSTRSKDSLPSGFGVLHSRYRFQTSADNYCDSMKNKLNPLRTLDHGKPPMSQSSPSDPFAQRLSPDSRLPPLSMPTSLPLRPSILEEPDRYTQTPHSAVSPRAGPFSLSSRDPRSPGGNSDMDSSLGRRRSVRTNSTSVRDDASVSPRGSYDVHGMEDTEIAETSSMRRLHLDDQVPREYYVAGLKRRASSPPGDDSLLHSMSSQGDLRRRELSRGSPTPRLSVLPKSSSTLSSTSRSSGSFNSSFPVGGSGSSAGMSNSFGRRSPGGHSPNGSSPVGTDGVHYSLLSSSRRGSVSRPHHQRTISDNRPVASPRKVGDMAKLNGQRLQGFILMCECCPKKPKKFQTREELSAHEAEKQYECSFCGNRFKNKNEAERHQNSLHVRRHSWSCKALTAYSQAFHESTSRPGEADTCGYCGRDFDRTGPALGGGGRDTSDQDWEDRVQHLTADHKFRECNSSKKFYRADHFRQHLKHSHAGSSGKWTNMLENACMIDEDPTPK